MHNFSGTLPGVDVSRAREPVIWALVDSAAGLIGQRTPDGLRVALTGEAAMIDGGREGRGSRQQILVMPLSYVVGLSCGELKVVIVRALSTPGAGIQRWIGRVAERIGQTMVSVERRRSVVRRPVRWCARIVFGMGGRVASRRELAKDAAVVGVFGGQVAISTAERTESVAIAFDWFWATEVEPLVQRGWRPPVGQGFRVFLEAPVVRAQLPTAWAGDRDAGGMLIGGDELEVGLVSREGTAMVALDWQVGSVGVVLSVWDDHVRRQAALLDGLSVAEVGQAVTASVEAFEGEQNRLAAALAGLGSALALALAGDGWQVGRLPGRGATLRKGGFTVRPDEEITRLRNGAVTRGRWIDRCEQLRIGDLRLDGVGRQCSSARESGVSRASGRDDAGRVVRFG